VKQIRLSWEPISTLDPAFVSSQVMKYMDGQAAFAQFDNDTCLMLKPVSDLREAIVEYHRKSKFITEFEVYPMHDGDYLVFFASPLLVYVGKQEFAENSMQIKKRVEELKFPSESIVPALRDTDETHVLVGLYARGKLQRDAWSELRYKFIKADLDKRFDGCSVAITT
jgi:hypothetical protein